MSAIGLCWGSILKARQAARIAASRASTAPTRSSPRCEDIGRRLAPSRRPAPSRSTTSVFESPPSTARMRRLVAARSGAIVKLGDGDEPDAGSTQPSEDARQSCNRRRRPSMKQHDDGIAMLEGPVDNVVLDVARHTVVRPVRSGDVPVDIPIAARRERLANPRIICALAKRTAKPWAGIDGNDFANCFLRLLDIQSQPLVA